MFHLRPTPPRLVHGEPSSGSRARSAAPHHHWPDPRALVALGHFPHPHLPEPHPHPMHHEAYYFEAARMSRLMEHL